MGTVLCIQPIFLCCQFQVTSSNWCNLNFFYIFFSTFHTEEFYPLSKSILCLSFFQDYRGFAVIFSKVSGLLYIYPDFDLTRTFLHASNKSLLYHQVSLFKWRLGHRNSWVFSCAQRAHGDILVDGYLCESYAIAITYATGFNAFLVSELQVFLQWKK